MNSIKRWACGVAFASVAMAVPSHASTVDFTNDSQFGPSDLTQNYLVGGANVLVGLEPGDGSLTFTAYDGPGSLIGNPLAMDYDGVGVSDDEITYGSEAVSVSFSAPVKVTAFHFLDLFGAVGSSDEEVAEVYLNDLLILSFAADVLFQEQGGYRFASGFSPFIADLLVFKAAPGNDGVGQADYALAAIEITAVPLPAALPLFATAMAGMGLIGWRRKRKATANL